MDPILLARIKFGLSAAAHYLFPPVSIGLAWIIVYITYKRWKTAEPIWESLTQLWTRVLALIFAAGVATGITLEFQFGTDWSTYSRYVGDIFGSPLAAEGVFSFFLESTFLGVLIFGLRRVSKKFYWFSALMVAIATTLSAFWIIVANSWMQTPVAYRLVGEGVNRRAELTNFLAAVFNPSTLPRYFHVVITSIFMGGFFMACIGAWYLLRREHQEIGRRCLQIGLVVAAIFSLLIPVTGHFHGVQVAKTQPAKLAAYEALFRDTAGAGLAIWGFPDVANRKVYLDIRIPKLLSFLIDFNPNSVIPGLERFPVEEWPPVLLAFYPFRIMVLLGVWFVLVSWWGLLMGKRRFENRTYLKVLLYSIFLPWISSQLGWMAAEFGRQPWAVYGLLKTKDAVSVVVPAWQILFSIIALSTIYIFIIALLIYLVRREFLIRPATAPVVASAENPGQREGKI